MNLINAKVQGVVNKSRGGQIVNYMQQFNFSKPQEINHYSIIPPLLFSAVV
jgi:hypothetical protein